MHELVSAHKRNISAYNPLIYLCVHAQRLPDRLTDVADTACNVEIPEVSK